MKRTLLMTLLLAGGCGPFYYGPYQEPFEPTAKEGDLLFLRTGHRDFYYIVDQKRDLCFFHARMYGRDHLAAIDCAKVPGARPPAADAPPAAEPVPVEPAPVPPAPGSLTDTDREAFRRAYIQFHCSQKSDTPEPLESILFNQGLDQERWDRAQAELAADPGLRAELDADAAAACP